MCRCKYPNNENDETGETKRYENHQAGSRECEWMLAEDCAKYQQETE